MNTKTASVRLDTELYEKIDEYCVSEGCSRNDFIKNAIEKALKKQDDNIDKKPYFDELGNRFYWSFDRDTWVCEVNPKNFQIVGD